MINSNNDTATRRRGDAGIESFPCRVPASPHLRVVFYGDDFTGSADALEALTLGGVRTALFLEPPDAGQLQGRFADLRAVGVASTARSMTPAQMDEVLPAAFQKLRQLGAPLFHYKVCSTFDSAPEIGSIGRALDIGQSIFQSPFVPLVVGVPALRRYVLFGNLFATVGAETFRIDRHPTMSRHPVTPMREGDLRLHLAAQTDQRIALLDILQLSGAPAELDASWQKLLDTKPDVVLFDALERASLVATGRLIWQECQRQPLFAVGSSGLGYALTWHWQQTSVIQEPPQLPSPAAVAQLIIVSGSCSPVTGQQIERAAQTGCVTIRLDAIKLINAETMAAEQERVIAQALQVLATQASVLLYSALGPDDESIKQTADWMSARGLNPLRASELLGERSGAILRELLLRTKLRRAVVAGGDTSGHTARQLGIYALELLQPIAPGSPLCRAAAHDAALDGLEIALKGGQGGQEDYFDCVRRGHSV